jgi:flagellar biosynthesis protein FlgN
MEPALYRDHLQKLFSQQVTLLSQLESLLDQEHTCILDQDIELLEKTGTQRQAYLGDLMRLEDERRNLCRMLGKPNTPDGLDQMVNWCDSNNVLRTQLDDCTMRATRCRDANDRNGILVSARLKHVKGLLDVITGRSQTPAIYSRTNAYAAAPTGRMIRSEA